MVNFSTPCYSFVHIPYCMYISMFDHMHSSDIYANFFQRGSVCYECLLNTVCSEMLNTQRKRLSILPVSALKFKITCRLKSANILQQTTCKHKGNIPAERSY
ncbi:hypothetical protein T09_1195 [Trichinella sp. T9]|nr:hypothetical protein T09_1195 [Trichinella sp. T9]